MTNPLLSPGPDVALVEIDADGIITTTLTDGGQSRSVDAIPEIVDRQRSRGIATQSFLKRKRRSWPIPRI